MYTNTVYGEGKCVLFREVSLIRGVLYREVPLQCNVWCMYSVCIVYVWCMYMYGVCTVYVWCMCGVCAVYVRCMYMVDAWSHGGWSWWMVMVDGHGAWSHCAWSRCEPHVQSADLLCVWLITMQGCSHSNMYWNSGMTILLGRDNSTGWTEKV